jgi:hypothetical protein
MMYKAPLMSDVGGYAGAAGHYCYGGGAAAEVK